MPSVGALFANLTFESASFAKGVDQATAKLQGMEKKFASVGGKIAGIGGKLSLGITAPLAGIGAAFMDSARDVAASVKEIEKSAQLSGAGFEGFQRYAFAAKSVGIEADKLTDILKDTTERFGEFAATGGGELKDFFDNVAPKVGITAAAFKNLSGPDALQLYYNSLQKAGLNSQQMTYYMEALASDATELAPLLANNGKLLGEMGDKAAIVSPEDAKRLEDYNKASLGMEAAMQKLTIAVVNSGLLDTVTKLVEKVAAWTTELSKTNPEVLKWGTAIAAAAATFGPALAGIGGMISGFGSLLPLITKIPGPIGIIATAVGAAYLAWQNWDKITAVVQRLYTGVKTWLMDKLRPVMDWVSDKIGWIADRFKWLDDVVVRHSYIPDMVDSIGDHMRRLQQEMVAPADTLTKTTAEKFRDMAGKISGIMDGLYPEAAALRTELENLAALEANPDTPLAALLRQRQRVNDQRHSAEAEANPALEQVSGKLDDAWSAVAATAERASEQLQAANDNAGRSFVDMTNTALNSLSNLAGAIKSGGFLDILSTAFNAFGSIAGTGLLGSSLKGSFADFSGITGFGGFRAAGGPVANGRAYVVGEKGPELFFPGLSGSILPNDFQMPAMPDVSAPSAPMEGIGGLDLVDHRPLRQNITIQVDARDAVLASQVQRMVAEGMMVAASQGSMDAQSAILKRQRRSLGR